MSYPKVVGRILSLGFPLPGIQVDNYTFLSAPSFFDYDGLVVDVGTTSALIESVVSGEATTSYAGARTVLHPHGIEEQGLADTLARRREETSALLERGGVVVVIARPEREHLLGEGSRFLDYDWLPLPEHLRLRPPLMVAGEGSQAAVVDWQHPMAAFVSSQMTNVSYRVHFAAKSVDGACVFARSTGGAAIGVELPLASGRLFLAPSLKATPSGDGRYAMSDALQQGIRAALGVTAAGRPPTWVKSDSLPGLTDLHSRVSAAKQAADLAATELATAESARDELAKYQRLLWQEGTVGLNAVVVDALRTIGFELYDRVPGELEVRIDGARALVEVEGSERLIDMTPHHRLRQRIERAIERQGTAPRGILFVNGQRLLPPSQRTQVTDSLRLAAETMRYCLAPAAGLYDAVVAKLNGDEEAVAAYRERLMAHEGFLS
jgi:hypothetical protein